MLIVIGLQNEERVISNSFIIWSKFLWCYADAISVFRPNEIGLNTDML